MIDKKFFFNKELSWLSFNERVLQEAGDSSVPLIERIHFLGIYSSNLDEFFRVRVADIRRKLLLENAKSDVETEEQKNLELLLAQIHDTVARLTESFRGHARQAFEELKAHNIELLFNDEKSTVFDQELNPDEKHFITTLFKNHIIRHITPIFIASNTQLVSCLDDDGIYLLVALKQQENVQYVLIEIPRSDVNRFIILPKDKDKQTQRIVMVDDIVHYFLGDIFKGMIDYEEIDAYSVKLTRDAEYDLNDELDQSLLDKMSKGLKQRLTADPVRLGYDKNMPDYMLKYLRKSLKIKDQNNLVPGVRYRHFKDFISFPNLGGRELEKVDLPALDASRFGSNNLSFDDITQNDILVYYPYHKFRHFTEFVRQASYDPLVKTIKINIYRVAKKSEIIHSLIEAVKNGKQVTVVVELRARFDEEANIEWAKRMKDAGIHVEFGIDSLKVHSKLCLVTRQENDKLARYAHIGTGNFHEKNARIYTDFSLFTKHKEIAQEVDNVFSFIAHSYKRFRFNHLIVSPLTSRRRYYQLIDNEINHAKKGNKAKITLKVNNLIDKGLITRLYQASKAGVKIDIIVRGMCSLVPGQPGISDNIFAISIVDQFLEHPRVMIFHNGGANDLYISSADWMERNIDHRVEVSCPIYDPVLKQRIIDIINIQLNDNKKARIINAAQDNTYVKNGRKKPVRSQIDIYNYLVEQEKNDKIARAI
ncbi:polyphosphate kinase 1 [Thalassotalea marina]|uniref:Polyphosphate kinase n=1 Tax=Thalassotalea marina TaxID=1673741 RepID=A0A919EIF7_9GAMM|nr:polyphosphate kinase 1 [Thalassotalea marina]GHF83860.1 polyphosphate kinase [Thalassotalea marina]